MSSISAGPQITENGTFLSTETLLESGQQDMLLALVINGTLDKQAEMSNQLRASAMNALGKGLRIDTSV